MNDYKQVHQHYTCHSKKTKKHSNKLKQKRKTLL